jgi:GNAT superfamily N-acetyltransferase
MATLCERLITEDASIVFVADQDGELAGMLGMVVYRHPISDEVFASEVFWWVEPEHRGCGVRLLKAAERWAQRHGATQLQMIAPTPQVAQLYQRLGYSEVETLYQRALA